MGEERLRNVRLIWLVVLSQLGWLACVLSAAQGWVCKGLMLSALCLGGMLRVSSAPARDVCLMLAAMFVGLGWDSWLGHSGIVVYASPGPVDGLAPAWILMLWALFGLLLRVPLSWLHDRPILAALLGGLGGALSYRGAVRLGAGSLPDVWLATAVLAGGWAIFTPLLLWLAKAVHASRVQ